LDPSFATTITQIITVSCLVEEAWWCKEWQGLMELCGRKATEI
jgi:hypothetical protein